MLVLCLKQTTSFKAIYNAADSTIDQKELFGTLEINGIFQCTKPKSF
jgi:hypothetical protein